MTSTVETRNLDRLAAEWNSAWPSLFGSREAVEDFFEEHGATLERLVSARDDLQRNLHHLAREVREGVFGRGVLVRGVVEWTNICSRHCSYCPMRVENQRSRNLLTQFKLDSGEIIAAARRVLADGLSVVFIQGGEVSNIGALLDAVRTIRREAESPVEILVNVGTLTRRHYRDLYAAGTNSCIIKLEEYDQALAETVTGYSYVERYSRIRECVDDGFKVGTGFILGLPGQSLRGIARSLLMAVELGAHMVSVAPLVPAPDTPMASCEPGDGETALNCMALMRLLDPSVMMPSVSAMSKVLPGAQARGCAFATTLTVNYSQAHRDQYLIYGRERLVVTKDAAESVASRAGWQSRSSEQMWSLQEGARREMARKGSIARPGPGLASSERTGRYLRR